MDSLESAPSVQIHTGQIGTTQIPSAMDVHVEMTAVSKSTLDSERNSENKMEYD